LQTTNVSHSLLNCQRALQQSADGLGKGGLNNQRRPAARIMTWAGPGPGTLGQGKKIGCWRPVERATARQWWRDSNQTAKHVDLPGKGLRTRVQFPPAPPLKLAKTLSWHFDEPCQAPSLAGVFTWACGLRHPPQGPFLALYPPFSSLFLCPLRTCKRPSPQGRSLQNQQLTNVCDPRSFFEHRAASQKQREKEFRQVCAADCVLPACTLATTSATRWRCACQHSGVSMARSKSTTSSGKVSSRIAAWMSGARVVRLTMRLT